MVLDKIIFPFKNIQYVQDESIKPTIKRIGWFCTYVPEELIIASGFTPFRITVNEKAKKAEGYFPINFCPFIKSSMEDLISSSENLSGVVFTNSCDGMRRFYDTCKVYFSSIPSFLLDVPRIKSSLSLQHFTANLEQMVSFLENTGSKTVSGKIRAGDLEQAIFICNAKRSLLEELDTCFKKLNKEIGVKNYFRILKLSMTAEPLSFIKELKGYLNEIYQFNKKDFGNSLNNKSRHGYPEIMIIGNFIDEERLWDIFDSLDCHISALDICSSERYFKRNLTESSGFQENRYKKSVEELVKNIAQSHLYKPQCMRMADLGGKISEIKNSIEKNNIKGVIFISQKFCDNTLLFYPFLREELNKIEIPSIFLEIEHRNFSAGQIKTRIQAFLEII